MSKKEYTLLWFIENYSYCWHKTGEALISPVFTINELQSTAWTLGLHPRGKNDERKGIIDIELNRNEDDGQHSISVTFQLSILREGKQPLSSMTVTHDFLKKSAHGFPFLKMGESLPQRKDEYLPNDVLTVRCRLWKGKGSARVVSPICARTRIGIRQIPFLLAVEGFSSLKPNHKDIYQIGLPSQKDGVKVSVYVSESGLGCEDELLVEISASGSHKILSKCELYLLQASGKKCKCAEADNRFDVGRKAIQKLPLSLSREAIINKKNEYLPGDILTLLCECIFSLGIEFEEIEKIQKLIVTTSVEQIGHNPRMEHSKIFREKLSACHNVEDDLRDIYSSKFLTDLMVKTKTNSFPAHKVVLCARSPVFKAMMSSDMKEKNSGSIQMDDLEDETVKHLLHFLYSDNVDDLQWETATKLYYVADKYQIEKLRLICSSFLLNNLTVSTSTELLLLAHTHSDNDLRKAVESFILENEDLVFDSNEWEELMEKNPQLAVKTMHLNYKAKKVGK